MLTGFGTADAVLHHWNAVFQELETADIVSESAVSSGIKPNVNTSNGKSRLDDPGSR